MIDWQNWKTKTTEFLEKEDYSLLTVILSLILGILVGIGILSFLNVTLGIMEFIRSSFLIILIGIGVSLGIPSAREFATRTRDEDITSEEFISLEHVILDSIMYLFSGIFVFGAFYIDTLTIYFPVLLDIKWETDWFHVSFPYLTRTLINIVQFILLYYLSRHIKRYLTGIINNRFNLQDYDYFDKKFFGME